MPSQHRILVVANRTADSPDLIAALRRHSAAAPTRFTLLVPAVPHGLSWAADMKAGWPEAISRAEAGVERMRLSGIDLKRSIVGDPDPFAAVGDALHGGEFDEVIVSTLPRGASRWLRPQLAGPAEANHRSTHHPSHCSSTRTAPTGSPPRARRRAALRSIVGAASAHVTAATSVAVTGVARRGRGRRHWRRDRRRRRHCGGWWAGRSRGGGRRARVASVGRTLAAGSRSGPRAPACRRR